MNSGFRTGRQNLPTPRLLYDAVTGKEGQDMENAKSISIYKAIKIKCMQVFGLVVLSIGSIGHGTGMRFAFSFGTP